MEAKEMSKCICVNLDKEEFLHIGELPSASYKDSSSCKTIEYFLGTEWSGDRIAFGFEGMTENTVCPDLYNDIYSYALKNFEERKILNSTPSFRYIINLERNMYCDKDMIPTGDDGSLFNPISLLMSASVEKDVLGINITQNEEKEIGIWCGEKVKAVNSLVKFPAATSFVSCFRNEIGLTGKLAGLNIVVTGIFPGYDRYEIKALVREAGGNWQDSVTKNTDYLVVATKPGNTKLEKARRYGISQISPDDFLDMLR